ncbi:MAG: hypothetical protein KC468_08115, partial [Myxococcales bacterium]|nr:hypothetical protein [Myxococcales bacterium]
VPAGLTYQWVSEISRVLPDYSVLVIGRKRWKITRGPNKGEYREKADDGEERERKWTEFQAGLWDIAVLSDSALGSTKVNEAAVAEYVRHRTGIMRSIRLSQAAAKGKKAEKRSERQRTLLEKGALAWVEDMLERSRPYDPGVAWDDLGIDFLVFDELGLYRNTFKPSEREFGVPMYMGSPGEPAKRAWQADFRAAVVRRNTGGRGILGLTGTLGENSPLEIYNAFHLIDPTIFEKVGITDPEQWLDRYLDIDTRAVVKVTGEHALARAVVGFRNLVELREFLFRWGNFVSA